MFGCLSLDGPHREGGLLAGLRAYLPLSRTTLMQQFLVPRPKISAAPQAASCASSSLDRRFRRLLSRMHPRAKRKIAAWDDDFLASLIAASLFRPSPL